MLICTLDREKIESLNSVIQSRNNLSPLNRFAAKDFSEDGRDVLSRIGMVDLEGNLKDTVRPTMNILSHPHAVVKVIFTGGAGTYEHNVNFDPTFHNHVSFTVTPESFSIDDESDPQSIVKVLEDFVGRSSLKSINLSKKFNTTEALVIAAVIDMERRSALRAFVDEIPMVHNSYNTNMIWRIINSTSSSIQWLVSVISEVIGEHLSLSLHQVQEANDGLIAKGAITQIGGLYQLSGELSQLPGRMIIIDNILSVQAAKQEDDCKIISTGFTCIQSGVHDLLFLDYNGRDIVFETITSARLLNYVERLLNCESYFSLIQS
jgi:hypothetical protein